MYYPFDLSSFCIGTALIGLVAAGFASSSHAVGIDERSWENAVNASSANPVNSKASATGITWGDDTADNLASAALHAVIDANPAALGAQPIELADGQRVTFSGELLLKEGVTETRVPLELRIGLFDTLGSAEPTGWLGYFFGNASSGGAGVFWRRSPRNRTLFVSVEGSQPLGSYPQLNGPRSNLSPGRYSFNLTLTRSGLAIAYKASMVRLGNGQVQAEFEGVDPKPASFTFDRVGFLAGRNLAADQIVLTDLKLAVVEAAVSASVSSAVPVPAPAREQPPVPQSGVVEIVPDGAWTWFNDERSIWHQGSLYTGYVTAAGDVGLGCYDPINGKVTNYVLGTARSRQVDDHNNPSLVSRADGRLVAVYAKHGAAREFYTRISDVPNPARLEDWGPELVTTTPANNTYANAYQLSAEGNALYSFHRSINWNPSLSISKNGGETWEPAVHFITAGASRSVRPYTRLVSNNTDRIDVMYTDGHPRNVENSVYHLYYKAGAVHRTDGEVIKQIVQLPLDHAGAERGSLVYPFSPEVGRGWAWDIHYGPGGRPVCAFQTRRADVTGKGWNHGRIYYYYAVWTGTEWKRTFIAHGGRALYAEENDYGGGMAIDPDDTRVVYISTNAAKPFDLGERDVVPLAKDERYEIWRGVTADGGMTFTWSPVTSGSTADNIRPAVPAGHGDKPGVLWLQGNYTTYTNYKMRVLGVLKAAR